MRVVVGVLCCALLQACSTVASADRPMYRDNYGAMAAEPASESVSQASLGASGQELDDARITALMNHQVKLPSRIRVAVVKLASEGQWRNYSGEFNDLSDSVERSLINTLRNSDRVYDASFLPSIMVPTPRTTAVLRESAARFQADLLLAYASACQSYQRYNFIRNNETKAVCQVEAVLLDTRSGVVAKTVVSSEEFRLYQQTNDISFRETWRKAELDATAKALGQVADEVVSYLRKVPVSGH